MKISKYPVKHSYKISRLLCDVFSLAFAVLIFSVTAGFISQYREMLRKIGAQGVAEIESGYIGSLSWGYLFALIFPAAVLAVFAVYLILTLKSSKFAKYNVTKQTAQKVYDWYAFAASLCKIPALMGIFDAMYIFQNRMLGVKVSLFSVQIVLDILITAIIIRFTIHRIKTITEAGGSVESSGAIAVKAKVVEKDDDKE